MDGWQLRRELLADPSLASIPVVLFTGTRKEAVGNDLEPAYLIEKPIDLAGLLAVVRRHCGVASSGRPA
jgi:CheY-like chemotaxis protein